MSGCCTNICNNKRNKVIGFLFLISQWAHSIIDRNAGTDKDTRICRCYFLINNIVDLFSMNLHVLFIE